MYLGLSLNAYSLNVPTLPGVHFSVFLKNLGIDLQAPPIGGLYALSFFLNSPSFSVLPFVSFGRMLHWESYGNRVMTVGLQVSPDRRKRLYLNGGFLVNQQVGVYSPYLSVGLRHNI